MPRRARPRPGESAEERSERRQEARERLRGRVNVTCCRASVTCCRPPGLPTATSPRQAEFLRRRNLAAEAGESRPGQRWTPWRKSARSPSGGSSPPCPFASTGTQTLPSPSSAVTDSSQQTDWGIAVLNKEMVQLSNYLKEALHRELLLKQKMVILQELLSTLLQASEKSWQGQLNEDKLRCKLRVLENQLQACTQSYSKECMKKILIEMEDQKQTYEQKAKEALQKMLEDKLLTEQQLQNSQRSLAEMREDLALWKEHHATLKAELTKETTAHTELRNSFQALQSELQVCQLPAGAARSGILLLGCPEQPWLSLHPWQCPGPGWTLGWEQPGPAEGGAGAGRGELRCPAKQARCVSVCLSVPAQRADAQSERLSRELRALRDERTELLQRASALRSDNDRQAGHIRHIQDKLQKEQEQKVTLEATISHLQNLIHNLDNQQKSQEVKVQSTGFHHTDPTSHSCQGKTKRSARAPRGGGGGNRKSEG
uniref:TRAF3 interacting protein 3 n=1 Tax=Serinus canaria TaxID=9135 RepID=A0A8C9UHT7_SERCA